MPSSAPASRLAACGSRVRRGAALLLTVALLHLLAPSALAIEVSEVTVDFPLAEVLEVPRVDGTAPAGEEAAAARAPGSPWEEHWFAYRQSVLRGNLEEARRSLDRMLAYRLRSGVPNLYLPSAALLGEAAEAARQSRFDDAQELIAYAGKLAPDDPEPRFQRGRAIWKQNRLRALAALDAVFEGAAAFFRDFRSYFPWALGAALWLLVGTLVASALAIVLVAIRILPRVAHDLAHLVPMPQWGWLAVLAGLLLVPFLLGVPAVPILLLAGLVTLVHASNRERVAMAAALLLLLSLPALLHVLAIADGYYRDAGVRALYEAQRGGEGAQAAAALDVARVKTPTDRRVLMTLGLVLKRSGQLREAEAILAQAAEAAPDSPALMNNLANIYLATGRGAAAIELYRRALQYGESAPIHYNLSQALRDSLQLEEGEREFLQAQKLDPDLTGRLSGYQLEEGAGHRITVDVLDRQAAFLRDGLRLGPEGRAWRDALWAGVVPRVPFAMAWLVFPVAAGALLAAWPLGNAGWVARRCKKCNQIHCSRCGKVTADVLCGPCRQIFIVRKSVDPAGRVRKMMQIMRFQKNRSLAARVSTVILPGAGHLYLGAGWQAVAFILVSTLFWTRWVLWNGLYRNAAVLETQPGTLSRVLFGGLMVLFYILALKGVGDRLEER